MRLPVKSETNSAGLPQSTLVDGRPLHMWVVSFCYCYYDAAHVPERNSGVDHFYSLSMNSSGDGGSGFNPFLFLTSATNVLKIELGTGCQALK